LCGVEELCYSELLDLEELRKRRRKNHEKNKVYVKIKFLSFYIAIMYIFLSKIKKPDRSHVRKYL